MCRCYECWICLCCEEQIDFTLMSMNLCVIATVLHLLYDHHLISAAVNDVACFIALSKRRVIP